MTEKTLENGLTVSFTHTARRYFGDYHQIRLEICCTVPVVAELFPDQDSHAEAVAMLGPDVVYRRCEEQMGVATADVEESVKRLVDNFCANSLAYFAAPGFPKSLVKAELEKARRPRRLFAPLAMHG